MNIIIGPIIMTLFGIFLLTMLIFGRTANNPPLLFDIFWFLGLVGMWYITLQYPFEITIRDDKTIEFRSVIRKIIVMPIEIQSIKASYPGFASVKLTKKSFHLINHFDGFHEFLTTVKSLNPNIIIKNL